MAEGLVDRNFACAAWNTAVLQGHCFVTWLDCLHLKSNHAKFQLNPIENVALTPDFELLGEETKCTKCRSCSFITIKTNESSKPEKTYGL